MKKKRLLKWPVKKEEHEYMRMREVQNIKNSKFNKNELWMNEKLKTLGMKWSRQSRWGYRIFDFWNHYKGIAVEVDGLEHKKEYDAYRDKANLITSGILVIRVKNMDEDDANNALDLIRKSSCWNARREAFGLKPIKSVAKICDHCES